MLQSRSIQPSAAASLLWSALLIIFFACFATIFSLRFSSSLQGTDFPDFYCAARIVLDGRGDRIYDTALQYRYQAQYAGRIGTLYIHPPFEAMIYLSVAWLPLRYAYVLWSVLNLLLVGIAARVLSQSALATWDWRILSVLALTFVPLLLCLVQGQDSILLFLLVVLAYSALRSGRNLAAGFWLALGLFKFQIVLSVVLVLLLSRDIRRRALATGFAAVGLALMGLSAAISGWSVFRAYPEFLVHLPSQRFAGIVPNAMPDFRGLVYALFHRDQSPWGIAVLSILSATALIAAIHSWKQSSAASSLDAHARLDLAFSTTVLFALLASYHLNPHDLTLLLLPTALTLYQMSVKRKASADGRSSWSAIDWTTLAVLAILFLPPLHVLLLRTHLYFLISVPLIVLFASITLILRKNRTPGVALRVDHD